MGGRIGKGRAGRRMLLGTSLIRSRTCARISASRLISQYISHHKHCRLSARRCIHICCNSASSIRSEGQVQIPLSERAFCYESSLQDVTSWLEAAKLQLETEAKGLNKSEDPNEEELRVCLVFESYQSI